MAQHSRIITIRDDLSQAELIALAASSGLKPAQQYEASDNKKQFTAVSSSVLFENNLANISELTFDSTANSFVKTLSDGSTETFDLNKYLDDTNVSKVVSGALDVTTGMAKFTRDDKTTFTVDFSGFLKDLNYKGSIVDDVAGTGTISFDDGDSTTDAKVISFKEIPDVTVNYMVLKDISGNGVDLKVTNNNGVLETEVV